MFRVCALLLLVCAACNNGTDKAFETTEDTVSYAGNPVFSTITVNSIPPGIRVKGNVQEAWKWTDATGDNVLILSQVPPFGATDEEGGEEGQTSELYASVYKNINGNYVESWLLTDAEKNCPLDLTCNFLPGSTTITDIDSNGIAEIKVQYALTCRGDVSPANMKLVMFENGRQYMLKGARWVKAEPEDVFDVTEENVNLEKLPAKKDEIDQMMQGFGRYESEKEFTHAPPAFLSFAKKEWLKYAKENIGNE